MNNNHNILNYIDMISSIIIITLHLVMLVNYFHLHHNSQVLVLFSYSNC